MYNRFASLNKAIVIPAKAGMTGWLFLRSQVVALEKGMWMILE